MPHNWGNISGFNNLPPKEAKKYGWYPMAQYTLNHGTTYSLVFLPEKETVVRVHEVTHRGLRDLAIATLSAQFNYRTAQREVPLRVYGKRYMFPNGMSDQMNRVMCALLEAPYECIAKNDDGIFETIVVSAEEVPALIKQILGVYSEELASMKSGLERIYGESEEGLRALLDTDLSEFYD